MTNAAAYVVIDATIVVSLTAPFLTPPESWYALGLSSGLSVAALAFAKVA